MNHFFSMDNKFFIFMGRLADLFILTILALVCCLPIVTIGASLTALYYVTLKMVRNEESYIFRSFFKSFKQNFKQATIINIIMLAAGCLLYVDMSIVRSMSGTISKIMQAIFLVFILLYIMIFVYVYPVLAKFYNSIKNTFRNALLMSLRHLPCTFLMILISASPLLVFFITSWQILATVLILILFFGLGLIAYCNSWFLVKIFDKYIPEDGGPEDSAEIPDRTGAQP